MVDRCSRLNKSLNLIGSSPRMIRLPSGDPVALEPSGLTRVRMGNEASSPFFPTYTIADGSLLESPSTQCTRSVKGNFILKICGVSKDLDKLVTASSGRPTVTSKSSDSRARGYTWTRSQAPELVGSLFFSSRSTYPPLHWHKWLNACANPTRLS